MDNLVYIIFICQVTPLALMTLMLRKRSRLLVGYMLIGISFASPCQWGSTRVSGG